MRNQVLIGLGISVGILCFLGACQQSRGLKQSGQVDQAFDTTFQEVSVENVMVRDAQYIERKNGIGFTNIINQIEAYPDGYLLMANGPKQTNLNVKDVYFLRTDKAGNISSTLTYDDDFLEQFDGELCYQDGHFYATSNSFVKSRAHNDFNIIKTKVDGEIEWSRTIDQIGNQVPGALLIRADAIYCFGRNISQDINRKMQVDLLIAKLGQDGSVKGVKKWGGPEHDFAYDIEVLNDSTLLLLSIEYEGGKKWLTLTSMDTNLTLRWTKKVVEVTGDFPSAQMVRATDGALYLQSQIGVDGYGYQILLSKLSSNGNLLWHKAYGLLQEGQSVQRIDTRSFIYPALNGNIIMAGKLGAFFGSGASYLFEVSPTGEVTWSSVLDNQYGDLYDITTKSDNSGYVLAGYIRNTLSSEEQVKGFLLSINQKGQTAPF